MKKQLKIPYIWFGGKRTVASKVWEALGDVDNYIEPFFGGGAVYLLRPHEPKMEIINDMDGFVSNFWRAVQNAPEKLAEWMYYPVNEVDLEARHRYLCKQPDKDDFLERLKHDPDFYDVKKAGWWCWGLNAWIGAGWCQGNYYPEDHDKSTGRGVCKGANKRPHISSHCQGVHCKRPHISHAGHGVHAGTPDSTAKTLGRHEARAEFLKDWMLALRDRLRETRVCCGDWSRVCTDGAMSHGKTVGVFLDPPYSDEANRTEEIYTVDSLTVAHEVREWCKKYGGEERYRIALCGYDTEHAELEEIGWRVYEWKTQGGYANFAKENEQGKINKGRETIWFSPYCLADKQRVLF